MLRIPLVVPMTYHGSAEEKMQDGWILWDNFRQMTGHKYKLSVALELSSCGELLACAEGEELMPAMFRYVHTVHVYVITVKVLYL